MSASYKDIILYIVVFASAYMQVFFLLVFLENRNSLEIKKRKRFDYSLSKTITFLVPFWNEEKTIINTVLSLKSLSYPQDKISIFLINDGSTDNSWEVVQKFANDNQIKLFNKENGGKHTALNYGLSFVESELVCCIDADTTLNQDALENAVSFFIEDSSMAAVGGNILIRNPQSIAQKAQSIEYQMYSFTKKMLAFMGGVMVSPGAFSVFRKDALKEIGGWSSGHYLEDMELTYRLHTKGYKIEHSNSAMAITSGPLSLRGLFKQRLRWGYGFIRNTFDYRFAMFNKKFGNFGFFTLPTSLISYITILSVFFITWYNMISFLYDKFLIFKLVGFHAIFKKVSFNLFYIDTKAIAFLSLLTFLFLVLNFILGKKFSSVKEINFVNLFYFFVVYSILVPLWVLKSIFNALIKTRPSWR